MENFLNEELNNKSWAIDKLNDKYKSILIKYEIKSNILNEFNVVDYMAEPDPGYPEMFELRTIYLKNETTNNIIKIEISSRIWEYYSGNITIYINNELLMGSYGIEDSNVQLFKTTFKQFKIPLFNSKLKPENSQGILHAIQYNLLLYYEELLYYNRRQN